MADFVINRGDNFPALKATLETRNETTNKWAALDLTEAKEVKLYMNSTEPAAIQVFGTCTISSPKTEGKIEYAWAEGDTEQANLYRLQFEITWNNGKTQTIPSNGYLNVEVQPDLAGDV